MKEDYEYKASTFDEAFYWQTEHFPLHKLAAENLSKSPPKESPGLSSTNHHRHNIFEGEERGKQLDESAVDFLARLPPKTTNLNFGPWLWVANPYVNRRFERVVRDKDGFIDDGRELLARYDAKRAELERLGKAKGTIMKMMNKEREELERNLVKTAKEYSVTSGKWLLFPMPDIVNDVWLNVVKATAAGELGDQAKVATDDGEGNRKPRVICIYNDDFEDKEEVRRILLKLVELGLVEKRSEARGIWYKCDAWTHLDIMSGNRYGLKATMYSSREVLREVGKK